MSDVEDLVAFLRARLDEDEQVAREAAIDSPGPWRDETARDENGYHEGKVRSAEDFTVVHVEDQTPQPETVAHIVRWDPARVLAEVEAKRRVIDVLRSYEPNNEWDSQPDIGQRQNNAAGALRYLALPYADHPDCREQWRP